MSHETNQIYEFGPFRLDAKERLLLRAGETVALTPKAFDLLLVLVERQGHLLAKDELMKLVWPDTFVEESNLSYNISFIRKALGEGESGLRFIETVPKRGYRFVGQVREEGNKGTGLISPSQTGADIAVGVAPSASRAEPRTIPVAPGAAIEEGSRPVISEENKLAAFRRTGRSNNQRRRLATIGGIVALIALMSALYYFRTAEMPIKTIAVLPPRPFQSGERDEALEMGTASILITRLGSLRQLIVRPENAVERYARPDQDPLAAGREQKVDAVLDSRYQRSGDKFRFTLRLLRVADGATLWADTLDQQAADLFAIEDALSAKVIGALRLTLSSADKELMAKRYTSNAKAWQLYVRGRHLLHTRRIPEIEKSIKYFQQAIALDQDFALAHTNLGYSYASLGALGHSPPKEVMPKAKAAYDHALKLDDQLAEAHAYLALYRRSYEWDFVGAEQQHRRAIDLNPNSADVHQLYAFYLLYMGHFDQAIAEINRAEELDPTSPHVGTNVSQAFFFARRYDEAIEQARRAIELNPSAATVHHWMIRAYEMKGDEQGAFAAYLKREEAKGAGPDEIAGMKAAFATGGLKGYWRRELEMMLEQEKSGYVQQHGVALLYARLDQKEEAIARLQRAVEDRNHYVIALKVEPLWDSHRTDPHFVALVKRVGLAP